LKSNNVDNMIGAMGCDG